eukprot:Rhum_TRINITY_DN8635_c0_g2::Rhum_TRINITY_DN8635_c0_g2_i1::g.29122::m.29122
MVQLKALRAAARLAHEAAVWGNTRKSSTVTTITDAAKVAAAAVAGRSKWESEEQAGFVARIGMDLQRGAARFNCSFDEVRRPLADSLRHLVLNDPDVPKVAETVGDLCGALYKEDVYAKAVLALRILDCPADLMQAVLVCQSCSSSRMYVPAVFDSVAQAVSVDQALLSMPEGQRTVGRLIMALACASPAVTPSFRQLLDAALPGRFDGFRGQHLRVHCVAMQYVLRLPGGAEPELRELARRMAEGVDARLAAISVGEKDALLLAPRLLHCGVTSQTLAPVLVQVPDIFRASNTESVAVLWILSVRYKMGTKVGARDMISGLINKLARDVTSLTEVEAARVLACLWMLTADLPPKHLHDAILAPMEFVMVLKNLERGMPFINDEALRQRCQQALKEVWHIALARYEARTGKSAISSGLLLDPRPKPQ